MVGPVLPHTTPLSTCLLRCVSFFAYNYTTDTAATNVNSTSITLSEFRHERKGRPSVVGAVWVKWVTRGGELEQHFDDIKVVLIPGYLQGSIILNINLVDVCSALS